VSVRLRRRSLWRSSCSGWEIRSELKFAHGKVFAEEGP
jgi:hypothetical protein